MTGWSEYVASVRQHLQHLKLTGCSDPLFRGQQESWPLLPSLSRHQNYPTFNINKEARLFFEFRDGGAHLMPIGISGWGQLFYMQHHGMPTRLLDWTASFGRALYFALRMPGTTPVVWVLDPYTLNGMTGDRALSTLHVGFKRDYLEVLSSGFPAGLIAASGDPAITRVRHQQGLFTCAGLNIVQPLEHYCPAAVRAFPVPPQAAEEARVHLALFGQDEFSVFPDLDGLSRSICLKELGVQLT